VGILTERDLLERVLEKCRNPKVTRISEIMTRHVITGKPDMELSEATEVMFKKKVKKLPIIEKNRLVGIVTLTDSPRHKRRQTNHRTYPKTLQYACALNLNH
jgi:CBS domain-containing protein